MFDAVRRRKQRRAVARLAYHHIVARARAPRLFAAWSVPDTLDGRFELLALHAFLVLNRLKHEAEAKEFAQVLFDTMFTDIDRGVRELGNADVSVGKQVKRMARGFYGRIAAYDKGLGDETELEAALKRNLFGTVTSPAPEHVIRAARYLRDQVAALAVVPIASFLRGEVPYAPLDAAP
ncbi:MAG: ubiquinol-cytochrome C chaperone family protein [Stellaceae bacterium]